MRRLIMAAVGLLAALYAPAAIRTGEASGHATLTTLDTCVHSAVPASIPSFDTVIHRLLTSAGGNLNTTPRGSTFIFR